MNTNCTFTDTHIHLDKYTMNELSIILKQCQEQGIKRFIVPDVAFNLCDWKKPQSSSEIYSCWGCHPAYCDSEWIDCYSNFAIGECGLDTLVDKDSQIQEERFIRQLELSKSKKLPIIIHSVRSTGKLISILKDNSFQGCGIIHGFTGSKETAKQLLDFGFLLGVGVLSIDKNAIKTRSSIIYAGISNIVLETDAPFFRGAKALNLIDVAKSCCELLNCTIEELSQATENSVSRIFNLGIFNDNCN